MRRRSESSAEEDDTNEAIAAEPQASESDGRKRSFTSAKYDITRHSDTLDRRKGDRVVTPTQLTQDAWTPLPTTHQVPKKQTHTPVHLAQTRDPSKMLESRISLRPRRRSPWSCTVLTLTATLLSISLLFSIYHSFFTRQLDPKGCKNCSMLPVYIKFSDFDTEHTRFASKYSLYLYREGGFDDFEKDPSVKGIPVLFIPGNAGSYKQVRPLAAEAAQYFYNTIQQDSKALRAGTRNLDFFSVDFNEDITAFHGQTLLDQAEYLNEAVAYILSLYHDPRRSRRDTDLPDPSAVILIGHSMGGVVARTMLTMPNYQSNSVNTIITMSAPHARPPVSFDAEIVHTYRQINDYWREAYSQKWANNNPLWHVTLISIAGGGLDTIVPSDYASLSSLVPDTHGFTVFTSSVPNVWTGADHLSILWCDQFRKVIVRSVLDIVDVHRPGQTKSRAERMRVFKRWYLTGMETIAEKTLPQKEPTTLLTLEDNSNSIIPLGERLVLKSFGQAGKPKAHLLPIPAQGAFGGKKFTMMSNQPLDESGLNGNLEVLFCSVFPLQAGQASTLFSMSMDLSSGTSGSTRLACKNAASDVIHLPASTRTSRYSFDEVQPFSYLQYQLEDLAEHQFVAVIDKALEYSHGWAMAEFSDDADSILETDIGLRRLLLFGMRLKIPSNRPMVTEVRIPALHSSLLAYKVSIGKQACGDDAELFTPLLRQYLSEPYESKYFVNVKEVNLNLHGIAPFMPPPLRAHAGNQGVSLQMWSDPTCNTSVDVSLKLDVPGSMGKLFMRYRLVLAAFPLLVIALVLRKQFKAYDENGIFMTFGESMDLCLRSSLPILLFAMSLLAIFLVMTSAKTPKQGPANYLHWGGNATGFVTDFSKNDLLLGSQDPFFWFLIPLFGLISVGVCVIVNYAVLGVTHVFCLFYAFLVAKPAWLKNDDRRRPTAPTFAASSPRRRIITASVLLLMVSTFIPYQFAYMVACIVQLATCTRALRFARETQSGSHYNFYNYAHSILVLMLWVLPINLPVLVVWVHNLAVHWLTPFSSHHNVLSIMPFILLVETLTSGKMIPRVTSSFRYITNLLFLLLAVYATIYGITYAYLLHHLVNFVSAWLVAIHFSGSSFSLSGLSQILECEESEGDVKKRP